MTVSGRAALAAWLLIGCSGSDPGALFTPGPQANEAATSATGAAPVAEDDDAGPRAPERNAGPTRSGGNAGAGGGSLGGAAGALGTGGATTVDGGSWCASWGCGAGGMPSSAGGAQATGGIPHIGAGGTTSAGGTSASGGRPGTGGTTAAGGAPVCDPAIQCASNRCYGAVSCGNGAALDCALEVKCVSTDYCNVIGPAGYCASFWEGLDCDTAGGTISVLVQTSANGGAVKNCHKPPDFNKSCTQVGATSWECSSKCHRILQPNGAWQCP